MNTKKKLCLRCYREAVLYQPPEVGLKALCLFPEQVVSSVEDCEMHDWLPSEVLAELYSWLDKR